MNEPRFEGVRVEESALIEDGVRVGAGSSVWDNVHIRHGAQIGRHCIIGEKTYIAYDVVIGDFCKLNASVYICAEVRLEDSVMISAHTVFTNDLFPRAFEIDPGNLASSAVNDETLSTVVRQGVTIGANATIGPGLELGAFSMVGMGSVVTHSVPPNALVLGNPARVVGWVCTCGPRFATATEYDSEPGSGSFECARCGRRWGKGDGAPVEVSGPTRAGH